MPFSLIWLPHVLKEAGLKVALVPGWEERGRGEVGNTMGVICHHTATPGKGKNMPTLGLLINGRPDLPGPLSQLGLGRDGTHYVVASGRCNHAGAGVWQGLTNGNANFIGIEGENTGGHDDFPWPPVQLDAYHRGVAAILRHIGRGAEYCAGHKEYALPHGRKSDPDFGMDAFRSAVAEIMNGSRPPPALIPAIEPVPVGGAIVRPTLRRNASGGVATGDVPSGAFTRQLQRALGLEPVGTFGPKTEAALREFQRSRGMVPDGIAGPKVWAALDGVVWRG